MLLETMIVVVCVQGMDGCNESTSAYYKQSAQLQLMKKNVDAYGKKLARNNEIVVYALAPLYATALGKTAHIKLYKGLMLNLNVKDQMIGLQWNY